MTNPTTKELQDAFALGSFSAQRTELRKLASPVIMAAYDPATLSDVIEASPICGDGPEQIKIRPTWSAFRDALDLDTLAALCIGSIEWNNVIAAIHTPHKYCKPNPASKTGYSFGRPNKLDKAMVDANNAILMGHSTPAKPVFLEGQFGLQDMVDIHDHSLGSFSNDSDALFDTMRRLFGSSFEDKIKATSDMIAIRSEPSEKTKWADLHGHVQEACRHIVRHMNDDDDEAEDELEVKPTATKYDVPKGAESSLIDLALKNAKLPPIATLIEEINGAAEKIAEAQAKAESDAAMMASASVPEVSSGEYPSGKVTIKTAADVFGITGVKRKMFEFKIPVWEWDTPHPLVPAVDENYVFRSEPLLMVLYAIITNQPAWLHGHTGCGKTTLLEQVSALTCFPFLRVNFDSEISRADLLGRDTLVNDGGATASTFVEGILPQMLQTPCIACFDECDFIRADVSYVMQRALEGNGLLLTEDGGRLIKPHPMFRAFATANTVGQGDEFGMYQGARVQSQAFLNRFKTFVHVPYMSQAERRKLITSHHKVKSDTLDKVCKYITEHLEAFTNAKVLQPISPRNFMAFTQAIVAFTDMMGDEDKAIEMAFDMTILNACTTQDKAVLKGIGNRVLK